MAGDLEASLHEVARHWPHVEHLHLQLARDHGCHILGASGPVFEGGRPVNRAVLYGPDGRIGHQDKQIMTRFEREDWDVTGAPGLRIFDTALGRIGVLICYDSEFPLLGRVLAEAGAELLLVPSCTDTVAGFHRVRIGAMARALDLRVVAEGVEEDEQLDLIAREGVQTYQGFLRAEPMGAEDFLKLARQ